MSAPAPLDVNLGPHFKCTTTEHGTSPGVDRFNFALTVAVLLGISPSLLVVSLPLVITLWPAGCCLPRSLRADSQGNSCPGCPLAPD